MKPLTQKIMALVQDTSLTLPDLAAAIDAVHDREIKHLQAALRLARGYMTGIKSFDSGGQDKRDLKTIDNVLEGNNMPDLSVVADAVNEIMSWRGK